MDLFRETSDYHIDLDPHYYVSMPASSSTHPLETSPPTLLSIVFSGAALLPPPPFRRLAGWLRRASAVAAALATGG